MVGKAYMKKEYYVDEINMLDIISIEEKLYELYRNTIFDFKKRFSSYNCDIEVMDCWSTNDSEKATNSRPNLENKYIYWICYVVLYNGKPFIYDNENSPLTRNYGVLVISKAMKRCRHKFIVKVFEDTEDVIEELLEDLNKIERLLSKNS